MHTMKPLFVASIAALLSLNVQAQSLTRPGTPPSTQSVNSAPAQFLPNAIITEGFDTVSGATGSPLCTLAANLTTAGWFAKNNAAPPGTTCVFNGGAGTTPPAQSGAATSYAAINFNSAAGSGDASTWFVTPRVNFGTGAKLEFWTRGVAGTSFADSMEVRLSSAADAGTPDVGTTTTSTGTFTTLLLSINPTLVTTDGACPATPFTATGGTITGYPLSNWCKITISGAALPTTGSGRIAFRYNTLSSGPAGANGNFLGIDTFSFDEGSSGPTSTFTAVTPSGTNITLARTLPAATSTSSLVFNVTGANAALTCTTTSPGYSVAPTPLNLVAGTLGTVTVTHTGSTAGSFAGTVTCTGPAGTAGGPFVYNFTTNVSAAVVPIIPVPALGNISLMLLMAGFLGLGMVLVGRRQA